MLKGSLICRQIESNVKTKNRIDIYIDADACPVKEEVLRVAARHKLKVFIVSNSWLRIGGNNPMVERVVVPEGQDEADNWIVEHISIDDIVVTGDIPLAALCLVGGAKAVASNGRVFTSDNIGNALAMRDLKRYLREIDNNDTYNASFTKKDRTAFLQSFENMIHSFLKNHK